MKSSNRPQSSRSRRKLRHDLKTLAMFTAIYCNKHHSGPKQPLKIAPLPDTLKGLKHYSYCQTCSELLRYAIDRRQRCPLDPKPACRDCPHNCYVEPKRSAMRRVMAFAGPWLIRRGRIDLLWRLYFG